MTLRAKAAVPFAVAIGLAGLLGLWGCRGRLSDPARDSPKPGASAHEHAALSSDPELAATERAAIASLGQFSAALAATDSLNQLFEIEAVVRDGADSEPLWLANVRPSAGGFEGTVNTPPAVVKSVQRGQPLRVRVRDVIDWAYEARGKPQGGETRRIARRRQLEAELSDAFTHCGEQRFADGCAALGENYEKGRLGEVRLDVAAKLYTAACAGGSAYGCNSAGWANLHGRGTARDLPAAAAFLARACTTGSEHPFACDSRGFALLSGLAGTPRDLSLGQRLLNQACARGLPQSCLLLELLTAKHLRVGPKLTRACDVNFSEQVSLCTIDQDPEACFLAGSAFETGVCGAHRSRTRAAELLSAAAVFGAAWPGKSGT